MYLMEKDNFNLNEGLLLYTHDESNSCFSKDKREEKSEFILEAFRKSGTYVTPDVPISGDLAIGSYWIH